MVSSMRSAIVRVSFLHNIVSDPSSLAQTFSTKYSLTLPASALQYIEQVLTEVSTAEPDLSSPHPDAGFDTSF